LRAKATRSGGGRVRTRCLFESNFVFLKPTIWFGFSLVLLSYMIDMIPEEFTRQIGSFPRTREQPVLMVEGRERVFFFFFFECFIHTTHTTKAERRAEESPRRPRRRRVARRPEQASREKKDPF